jgi:hypothetical protein
MSRPVSDRLSGPVWPIWVQNGTPVIGERATQGNLAARAGVVGVLAQAG